MTTRVLPAAFEEDEVDAILIGLCLVVAAGEDADVVTAAMQKFEDALPAPPILVEAAQLGDDAVEAISAAIVCERKVLLDYVDARSRSSERIVWPIAAADTYGGEAVVAWCEMRRAFRQFRLDRIRAVKVLDERYQNRRKVLLAQWRAGEDLGLD
jgi:predicted DNA-binding transcriptional regulator YafY